MRRALLACAVALGAVPLLGAPTALAYRNAPAGAKHAMRHALDRDRARACGGGTTRIRGAAISTADPRYGTASCGDFGHFYNVLRRPSAHSGDWRVALAIGDGIPECSEITAARIPRSVIRDLRLYGLGRRGRTVLC